MTKQIKIEELIPYMNDGWVAMDKNGGWVWFSKKPLLIINDKVEWCNCWMPALNSKMQSLSFYNEIFRKIKKSKDWTKSLIKVGGK